MNGLRDRDLGEDEDVETGYHVPQGSSVRDSYPVEVEEYYRSMTSLTRHGLAVSDRRRDRVLLCRDPFEDTSKAIVVRTATIFRPPILLGILPNFSSSSDERIRLIKDCSTASDATSCRDLEEGECHHKIGSCFDVTEELEDYYRVITSLTSRGLEISNSRREKILLCQSPFRELGGVFVATSVMPAIVRDILLHMQFTVSVRVRLFDGWKAGYQPYNRVEDIQMEFEDYYQVIPSLSKHGTAISNARREKILLSKNPFERHCIKKTPYKKSYSGLNGCLKFALGGKRESASVNIKKCV